MGSVSDLAMIAVVVGLYSLAWSTVTGVSLWRYVSDRLPRPAFAALVGAFLAALLAMWGVVLPAIHRTSARQEATSP